MGPREEIPRTEELDKFVNDLNKKEQSPQNDITNSAGELQAFVKESAGRAGGPDRWLPDQWNMLPKEFFEQLENLGIVPERVEAATDLEKDQGGGHLQHRRKHETTQCCSSDIERRDDWSEN